MTKPSRIKRRLHGQSVGERRLDENLGEKFSKSKRWENKEETPRPVRWREAL